MREKLKADEEAAAARAAERKVGGVGGGVGGGAFEVAAVAAFDTTNPFSSGAGAGVPANNSFGGAGAPTPVGTPGTPTAGNPFSADGGDGGGGAAVQKEVQVPYDGPTCTIDEKIDLCKLTNLA